MKDRRCKKCRYGCVSISTLPKPGRHKTKQRWCWIPSSNRKKHSSQPFGRYGKPKSSHGKKPNLSHGKSRHRGQPMQALQATHVTLLRPPWFPAKWQIITVWFVTHLLCKCWDRAVVGYLVKLLRTLDWLAFHPNCATQTCIAKKAYLSKLLGKKTKTPNAFSCLLDSFVSWFQKHKCPNQSSRSPYHNSP